MWFRCRINIQLLRPVVQKRFMCKIFQPLNVKFIATECVPCIRIFIYISAHVTCVYTKISEHKEE
jgi:hypothetical protein